MLVPAAKVSIGSLYQYFPTRQHVVRELEKDGLRDILACLSVAGEDGAVVGPRAGGGIGAGLVNGIARVAPAAVAVGDIVAVFVQVNEDAFGEFGWSVDGDFAGDGDEVAALGATLTPAAARAIGLAALARVRSAHTYQQRVQQIESLLALSA